jgi:hypothetical protein
MYEHLDMMDYKLAMNYLVYMREMVNRLVFLSVGMVGFQLLFFFGLYSFLPCCITTVYIALMIVTAEWPGHVRNLRQLNSYLYIVFLQYFIL